MGTDVVDVSTACVHMYVAGAGRACRCMRLGNWLLARFTWCTTTYRRYPRTLPRTMCVRLTYTHMSHTRSHTHTSPILPPPSFQPQCDIIAGAYNAHAIMRCTRECVKMVVICPARVLCSLVCFDPLCRESLCVRV